MASEDSASIEWLESPAGILRVHPENGVYGDPYSFCCTITAAGDMVMLHGTLAAPTQSQFRAMKAALREAGFKAAKWIRIGTRDAGRRKASGRETCMGRREVIWELK